MRTNHFASGNDEFFLLSDFLKVLRKHRVLFYSVVIGVLILAATYGFLSPKLYRASVEVVPVQRQGESAGLLSSLGGLGNLASIAGLQSNVVPLKDEALATIRSKDFLFSFITENNLLPVLFSNKYDAKTETWMVDSEDEIPTNWDGYRKFRKSVLRIQDDDITGLVVISVEWHDRFLAEKWANAIVSRINEQMRMRDIAESEKRIEYLRRELKSVGIVEIERSIYRLVELEINNIMVANVRKEYAFRVVDPAIVPDADRYFFPRFVIIIPIGLVLGVGLAVFLVFIRRIFTNSSNRAL